MRRDAAFTRGRMLRNLVRVNDFSSFVHSVSQMRSCYLSREPDIPGGDSLARRTEVVIAEAVAQMREKGGWLTMDKEC